MQLKSLAIISLLTLAACGDPMAQSRYVVKDANDLEKKKLAEITSKVNKERKCEEGVDAPDCFLRIIHKDGSNEIIVTEFPSDTWGFSSEAEAENNRIKTELFSTFGQNRVKQSP